MSLSARLYLAFFACSLMLGSWYPRIADVQSQADMDGWALGQSLSGYPVGILLMFTFGTRFAARLSFQLSFRLVVPALGAALVIATLSTMVPLLFAALLVAGALQGILAITGNVEADRMETALGRKILVRAHGFYSLGTVLAGVAGIGFQALGLAPWLHLTIMLPLATAMAVVATQGMEAVPARAEETTGSDARIVRPTLAVVMLFIAGGASLYLDNAASDWSVILLRDGYALNAVAATVAVTVWALGQAFGRLSYPVIERRIGETRLALGMACIASVGLALVVLSAHAGLAMLGLVLMGFGTSALFPMAISAAARLTDRPSAVNVASLSQLAFLAAIATPIVLGGLVELSGIRLDFASGFVVMVASLAVLLFRKPFGKVAGGSPTDRRRGQPGDVRGVRPS